MHTQTHTQCLLKTNVKFYSNKDIRTMVNCTFNKNFKDRYCQLTQKAQDQPIHPKGGGTFSQFLEPQSMVIALAIGKHATNSQTELKLSSYSYNDKFLLHQLLIKNGSR